MEVTGRDGRVEGRPGVSLRVRRGPYGPLRPKQPCSPITEPGGVSQNDWPRPEIAEGLQGCFARHRRARNDMRDWLRLPSTTCPSHFPATS
jgi:hypothetical protein